MVVSAIASTPKGKHLRNWDYISEVYLNPEKEAA